MLESIDFSVINYKLRKCQKNRRERISSKTGYQSREYQECYKNYKAKNYYIGSLATYPIYEIKYKIPIGFNNKICNYTEEG